jgi:predicted metal-dependent hydrolase
LTEARSACAEPPPLELLTGIAEFNRREFFACHETLEALWLRERRPVRELYQGVLQVGVGLYHAERGNRRGAMLTMERGLARLRALPPVCQGVEVAQLVVAAELALAVLQRGPAGDGPALIDAALVPTIQLAASAEP